jgi:DNA polymerase V
MNIHEYLTRGSANPISYIRVRSDSIQDIGIRDGDLLVVQRTGFAKAGGVGIAEVNGEFTVKRLKQHRHGLYLVPANHA